MSSNHDDPTSRTASNRPPDGPAVGADGSDTDRDARLGRRTFVKGLGALGATTAGLSIDGGFAQDAEAIAPLIGAGIVAGSVGVGWALREFEIVGSDAPPEGLTGDALTQQVYQTSRTRKSTNGSTVVDNRNILNGVEHTAYTDAKVAAIEALNAGETESNVLDAATAAIDTYETTVKKNFLKTWNESAAELDSMLSTVASHSNISYGDVWVKPGGEGDEVITVLMDETTVSMPDGTNFTVHRIDLTLEGAPTDYNLNSNWDPTGLSTSSGDMQTVYAEDKRIDVQGYDGADNLQYLVAGTWTSLYDEMDTTFQNVRNGISTWVTNVYGDVQSGEIEIGDLVTPRERASMMAEEEGMSQAIADLIALNVPVDAEREATITIDSTGAKLTGTFALTDSTDGPIESGTAYDPSTFTGDVYFTTDMSLVEGTWDAINTSVDGGNITITAEPYEGTAIEVTTTASETVSVPAADWTDNGDGTWTYDASGDLETAITEVDSARFVSTATDTQYETLQLQGPFTVNKLMNTQSGEEVSTTSFTNSEPQTDSNYITQEEWDQLEQQNQELIEKYENSQSGGSIDLGQFDMFGIPGEIVAVAVAALVALGVLNN